MTILAEPPKESTELLPPRDITEPWEPKSDPRMGEIAVVRSLHERHE